MHHYAPPVVHFRQNLCSANIQIKVRCGVINLKEGESRCKSGMTDSALWVLSVRTTPSDSPIFFLAVMRTPKKKNASPVPKPGCYCITDEQGTVLHRIDASAASQLRVHHFAALAHLFETTERFERLQAILTEWHINQLYKNFGKWEFEFEDLADFGQLLDFLSRCYRQPSALDIERVYGNR